MSKDSSDHHEPARDPDLNPDNGEGSSYEGNLGLERNKAPLFSRRGQIQCATVGGGTVSVHGSELQSLLDSGASGDYNMPTNAVGASEQPDHPLPHRGAGTPSPQSSAHHYQHNSALYQLWFNQHMVALTRSLDRVINTLRGLQEMNASWKLRYPPSRRGQFDPSPSPTARPPIARAQTMGKDTDYAPSSATSPAPMRRSLTSIDDRSEAESSKDGEQLEKDAPRLVRQELETNFAILKLDLKLGPHGHPDIVHSLELDSIASLLDQTISYAIRHLQLLRERVEDTSSKVLVTGDVNAGKSTFCNALLRRKILPEDQQPCTSIFSEVLDARENNGLEEVHAVHIGATYHRNDERTFSVFKLQDLETIVTDNANYAQCKVYIKDIRAMNQSLLNNGVMDITLIDAPGLNSHTTKTTAVFARQEEIDVVVFVVSASNHFTISAQDFIMAATAEKAYLFIVVNSFDAIKDQERCKKTILSQIRGLSPQTYKEATDLVHFVSSEAVPVVPTMHGPSPSGNPGGNDPADPTGKGKDVDKIRDFDRLEESLRRFVLEKRATSKLAPARHYLLNILGDINMLAETNHQSARVEHDKQVNVLEEITSELDSRRHARNDIDEQLSQIIESVSGEVYDETRRRLNSAVSRAPDNVNILYPGLLNVMGYAEMLKEAMLAQIAASVVNCEEHARDRAVEGVNAIKQIGLLHLGSEYNNLSFRSNVMFQRKRDILARQVAIPTELADFVDWSVFGQGEKVAGTGMALTVATAVGGRLIGLDSWATQTLMAARFVGNGHLRKLAIPGLVLTALAALVYIAREIPNTLPRRISAKLGSKLATLDYVDSNAMRISNSVRKVLTYPANNIRSDLDHAVKDLCVRRDESVQIREQSAVAAKYFSNLVRDSMLQKRVVEEIDLDATPLCPMDLDPQQRL